MPKLGHLVIIKTGTSRIHVYMLSVSSFLATYFLLYSICSQKDVNVNGYSEQECKTHFLHQVLPQIGLLLSVPEKDQHLQIYFMDSVEKEINQRCTLIIATDREVIAKLRSMFRNHNCLVRDCKSAIEDVRSYDFRANEAPSNEHERRSNGSRISSCNRRNRNYPARYCY
ncbi:hypothetical protein TNCT_714571 [Trichonephila clavata]|uniref:Uncharacterized protein n=1 Tax=Trichonephila clavata TaxID=2740835 RepID=A0A8X6HT30_TRICU|nr:hypothetical protein TNCT_714571 [Trichonephila clavata]